MFGKNMTRPENGAKFGTRKKATKAEGAQCAFNFCGLDLCAVSGPRFGVTNATRITGAATISPVKKHLAMESNRTESAFKDASTFAPANPVLPLPPLPWCLRHAANHESGVTMHYAMR